MYESMNGTGMSRLPKVNAPASASPVTNALGRTVGTAVVQAVAVVVARIVDALLESYMNRRRAQQAPAPQRSRREEAVA